MSKEFLRSLLLAFVGALALNLYAEVAWTTGACAPSEWIALERNLLKGLKGTMTVNNPNTYGSSDLMVIVDGEGHLTRLSDGQVDVRVPDLQGFVAGVV